MDPTRIDPQFYEDFVGDWEKQFPQFAKYGWGFSTQAEKWNGRHAMFGWFVICACAYAKGHGLLPDPEATLDLKTWGTLATITGKDTISAERATVLMANMHFFAASLAATFAPPAFMDKLFLAPDEAAAPGYGYMPEIKPGINETTEMLHGRFAMVGLTALVFATVIENKSMIDIVNDWVGGLYF